ncbi:phosphatase PAP2 family protein [uncultured Oscillibacter sp.]|uniref:phosphatase PAP2 family protein n=1 Tax=uncultured Oscillibacter sp. TaxID=876091 RepID=UPI0025FF83F6|nr:phosphatase PAP2 family protein [uncultured Oscillibacter sp.]
MRLPPSLRAVPWAELKYALWLPVYLLSFAALEHLPIAAYWPTQLPLDDRIPFCEGFVVFYCAWYFLLLAVGLGLLVRDRRAFRRYMCFLAVTFFLSEAVWLLVPNGQDLRPAVMPRDNLCTALVGVLYRVDTNTNVFPSVHVVGAVGAALAVWDCRCWKHRRLLRWGTAALAALICAATLFIKQHAVLDVVSALALSLAAALFLYRRHPEAL